MQSRLFAFAKSRQIFRKGEAPAEPMVQRFGRSFTLPSRKNVRRSLESIPFQGRAQEREWFTSLRVVLRLSKILPSIRLVFQYRSRLKPVHQRDPNEQR